MFYPISKGLYSDTLSVLTYIIKKSNQQANIHTYIPTYLHTYIPTCIHRYTRTCIHTHIHTYITYIQTQQQLPLGKPETLGDTRHEGGPKSIPSRLSIRDAAYCQFAGSGVSTEAKATSLDVLLHVGNSDANGGSRCCKWICHWRACPTSPANQLQSSKEWVEHVYTLACRYKPDRGIAELNCRRSTCSSRN